MLRGKRHQALATRGEATAVACMVKCWARVLTRASCWFWQFTGCPLCRVRSFCCAVLPSWATGKRHLCCAAYVQCCSTSKVRPQLSRCHLPAHRQAAIIGRVGSVKPLAEAGRACCLPFNAAWGSEGSPAPQAVHCQIGTAACQPGSAPRKGRAAGREAGAPYLGHRRRLQLPTLRMGRYLQLPMGRGAADRGQSQVGFRANCTVTNKLRPQQVPPEWEACRHFSDVLDVLQGDFAAFLPNCQLIWARQQDSAASSVLLVQIV